MSAWSRSARGPGRLGWSVVSVASITISPSCWWLSSPIVARPCRTHRPFLFHRDLQATCPCSFFPPYIARRHHAGSRTDQIRRHRTYPIDPFLVKLWRSTDMRYETFAFSLLAVLSIASASEQQYGQGLYARTVSTKYSQSTRATTWINSSVSGRYVSTRGKSKLS